MPANRLLAHYVDNRRELPWRAGPGEPAPDAYRVWLSEVMLQQTTVAAVLPRFERFVARWPTVEALAAAPEEEVLGEWAGLGYYARARNLIACARAVAASGGFPDDEERLRALPGVGEYTAAAVAAIAFGERVAAVDTNVARVVARLHGLLAPARGEVRALAAAMMGEVHPGDFTQAVMDLGATICRPRAPECGRCPLQGDCAAFASGEPEAFPARKAKKVRPRRHGIAWWSERDGCVWLVRRPARGLLGGMAALPGDEWAGDEWAGDRAAEDPALGSIRHVFTHFALELRIVACREPVGDGWWQPLDRLADAGLPTVYRRAVEEVLAGRGMRAAA